jgi:manganese/iron transport system ATP-binding protein/manganese/zinc/iron transport system ATP- binding protein
LEFDHVSVAYQGRPVLNDVSFEVPHGAQVAIVGPNGAGKSTLFKALVNLLPLSGGQIRIHGLSLDRHQDCVAYIPQREEVDWRFPVTVWDVVMMGRLTQYGWFGRPSREDQRLVAEKLELMGIAALANRAIGELSGGQQQRVFLARALAQEPHILLMDEPFTGVDIVTQEATLQILDSLRQQAVTVLVSTHDLNLAARRFDLTALINHRLIAFGSAAEVFTSEKITTAFNQVMYVNGAAIVDDCCGPEGDDHHPHLPEARP